MIAINLNALLGFGSAALAGIMAAGSALRARREVQRWAFSGGMACLAAERFFAGFTATSPNLSEAFNAQLWQLIATSFLAAPWLAFALTFARGNAWMFLRRWAALLAASLLVPIVALAFTRHLMTGTAAVGDPPRLVFMLGAAGTAAYVLQLLVAVLILMNLERTYRAATGTVRWRIKFFLFGVGLLFLARLYTASQSLLFRGVDPSLDVLNSCTVLIVCMLILRSLLRAGHFDVDVYPSQSVLQGSATIIIAGAYLLIVGVFAKVVAYLGGDSSFAAKTFVGLIGLVALAMVIQSDRVRLRVRLLLSRHFQRPLHDYREVWRRFTESAAKQVDQRGYCDAIVKLLADIFQTLSVAIWVVDERREELTLVASTSVTSRQAAQLQPGTDDAVAIISYLRNHAEPLVIEDDAGAWAAALRRCHPEEFPEGGKRLALPVLANSEVLGVILLGDRVSGAPFTAQDLDLMQAISDQVASGLLRVRLSDRLLQAREHEAFQTMATFFVHDLKNAASTLNLMLRNLPDHFDDPAFRADALRGVGKSVDHINHLIGRLGELRQELKLTPALGNINEVVNATVAAVPPEAGFEIRVETTPVPAVHLDREQFGKVLLNLILNAREARTGPGWLRLATRQTSAGVVIEAADNGSGMSKEFIARSLFRPFQTTKKNGLGIGMFQSKMIVEAHHGSMTVESTPGQGTTFRIVLPLPNS